MFRVRCVQLQRMAHLWIKSNGIIMFVSIHYRFQFAMKPQISLIERKTQKPCVIAQFLNIITNSMMVSKPPRRVLAKKKFDWISPLFWKQHFNYIWHMIKSNLFNHDMSTAVK